MIEEVRLLREKHGVVYLSIRDDTFTAHRQRVLDFCRGLEESGIRGCRDERREPTSGRVDLPSGDPVAPRHQVAVPGACICGVGALLEEANDFSWNRDGAGHGFSVCHPTDSVHCDRRCVETTPSPPAPT